MMFEKWNPCGQHVIQQQGPMLQKRPYIASETEMALYMLVRKRI